MTDQTEHRLRLAHQARRAKEHQLDDIRRALCDIGFMDDDDPYSHADLADVIRQNGEALLEASETPHDGSDCDQRAKRAEAAIDRVRFVRGRWLLMTLEPGQVRRLLDEVGYALDDTEPPAPDFGPSVAEAAANDRAHWNDKYAGEGA